MAHVSSRETQGGGAHVLASIGNADCNARAVAAVPQLLRHFSEATAFDVNAGTLGARLRRAMPRYGEFLEESVVQEHVGELVSGLLELLTHPKKNCMAFSRLKLILPYLGADERSRREFVDQRLPEPSVGNVIFLVGSGIKAGYFTGRMAERIRERVVEAYLAYHREMYLAEGIKLPGIQALLAEWKYPPIYVVQDAVGAGFMMPGDGRGLVDNIASHFLSIEEPSTQVSDAMYHTLGRYPGLIDVNLYGRVIHKINTKRKGAREARDALIMARIKRRNEEATAERLRRSLDEFHVER